MNVNINEISTNNKEKENFFEEKCFSELSMNSNISGKTKLKIDFKNININNYANPYKKKT